MSSDPSVASDDVYRVIVREMDMILRGQTMMPSTTAKRLDRDESA